VVGLGFGFGWWPWRTSLFPPRRTNLGGACGAGFVVVVVDGATWTDEVAGAWEGFCWEGTEEEEDEEGGGWDAGRTGLGAALRDTGGSGTGRAGGFVG